MTTQTRLRIAIALLIAIVFIGATGFHLIEGWPWFDGLYMTVITMTTIGLAAVIAGTFLISASTTVMLQFELHNFLGRRRMQRELARLHDHYIICGAGRVGRSVARELHSRGARFSFVEKSDERAQWALDRGFPVVIGNAHSEEDLARAHIDSAKGLVAAVTSDAENLYIVLTARGMNRELKIIARASEEEAIPKLIAAGTVSFNPRSDTVIHAGDFLIAVGSVQHLQALASLAQG